MLLGNKDAVANIAVKNLDTAKKFYQDTLGLKPIEEMGEEAIIFQSGNTVLNIYRSKYAGTNQATAVTWPVGDNVEGVVQELKSKGIRFEHYDMPGLTQKGDVHIAGTMKTAWFKDPDGNILNIINS